MRGRYNGPEDWKDIPIFVFLILSPVLVFFGFCVLIAQFTPNNLIKGWKCLFKNK